MKAVRATLVGGLGNQMFIAAAAAELAQRLRVPLEFDHADFRTDPAGRRFALDMFPNLASRATGIETHRSLPAPLRRRLDRVRRDIFVEAGFPFDPRFQAIDRPVRLRGYFQAHRYFASLDAAALFALDGPNLRLAEIEATVGTRWFGLHVRRGDYLNPTTADYHGLCSDDYFSRGLSTIQRMHGEHLPVVLFTDQPHAVSHRVLALADFVLGPDINAHEAVDLWAMSHASGLVMSNSSFSWWAGFLGERQDRPVVAPRPWLRALDLAAGDLLLPHWITLGAAGPG